MCPAPGMGAVPLRARPLPAGAFPGSAEVQKLAALRRRWREAFPPGRPRPGFASAPHRARPPRWGSSAEVRQPPARARGAAGRRCLPSARGAAGGGERQGDSGSCFCPESELRSRWLVNATEGAKGCSLRTISPFFPPRAP